VKLSPSRFTIAGAMLTSLILSIGDELVLGQTIDTNSAWISQQLAAVGIRVAAHATVPDDLPAIKEALSGAAPRCDVLIVSGGLGPTEDDLTRQALAAVLGVPLETHEQALRELSAWFAKLGRPMSENNKIQAKFPRGTTPIENTCGTAPGIRAEVGIGSAATKARVYVMPGVPKEMKEMFQRSILPELRSLAGEGGAAIVSRTLHTFGAGESLIGERLGELMDRRRNPSVGTTVSGGVVSVRINSYFTSRDQALAELENTAIACRQRLGDLIYGQDEETLAELVAKLLRSAAVPEQLRFYQPVLATAESCTGGLLAKMLTDIPGSSTYFRQGYVTYSNESKTDLLLVSAELIAAHGAVSEPVAEAMARGAQEQSGAPYALAITGIAGPDGGTPQKPVGTVCIALANGAEPLSVRTFHFPGDREMVRDRSAKMALTMLRFALLGKPMPF
jgi:nicotinamide-nucleotide amidase